MHHCVFLRTPVLKNKNNFFEAFVFCCHGWKAEVMHETAKHWAAKITFHKRLRDSEMLSFEHLFPPPPICLVVFLDYLLWLRLFFVCSDHQHVLKLNTLWFLSRKLVECGFSQHQCDYLMGSKGKVYAGCFFPTWQKSWRNLFSRDTGNWNLEHVGFVFWSLQQRSTIKQPVPVAALHLIPSSRYIFCWHYLHLHLLHDNLCLSFYSDICHSRWEIN